MISATASFSRSRKLRCCFSSVSIARLHLSSRDLLSALDDRACSLHVDSLRQSHGLVITTGYSRDPFFASKLVSAYSACHDLLSSRLVFDAVGEGNVYLCNTLLSAFARGGALSFALELFREMCRGSVGFDEYTLATLSKAVADGGDAVPGKVIHGVSIRSGFLRDTVLSNSLMAMYDKCAELGEIKKLFDDMHERNISSWNVLISGYMDSSSDEDGIARAWNAVRSMQEESVRPDMYTVSSLLPLCGSDTKTRNYGRELHGYVLRTGLDYASGSDIHLSCCLIDMYSKARRMDIARHVFESSKSRNVYAWTAMINGLVKSGDSCQALFLFREMVLGHRIQPTSVSLISILPACVMLCGLSHVRQIHAFAIRRNTEASVSLQNALIDSYIKSGSLTSSKNVFDAVTDKTTVSWSSVVSGYGLYGKGEEALKLYQEMLHLGFKPDPITLVSVLSACAKSGLVEEGLNTYNSATNRYGVQPTSEICSCVVDLLGRSNQLDRALDFIKNMEVEARPSVWGALFNAALMRGDHKMRDLAYKFLMHMEPENPSNLVSLSNLYAESQNWEDVALVRKMMNERGLRKQPGCSWITIEGRTDYFYAADKVHPSRDLIYETLHFVGLIMKGVQSIGNTRITET
ncbi:hypothetical protein MLD38_039522 [Melastoma candidum]|uniref:Uncharacterized protein n=1 Tax=Melastoma candidum TaxID=119954 RepID=A0ACB9L333_9MYRT|nr:hypothetical protein MLD38_039522 [Melastoma candidum]